MKILVTGGTGFLGRHLVWRFAASGADVVFTGRRALSAAEVCHQSPKPVRWQPVTHGAPDAESVLTRATEQADVVVHCAALSAPWGRTEDFYRSNVASTSEVLAACHATGVRRLIHISTPSLYFDFKDHLNIREDQRLPQPANEYVRTKAYAETLIRANPAPETVILRPRGLFGPWDQALVPRLLRVMQNGGIPLMRGGRIKLDLTYIDNAVEAVWLAATQPLPASLVTYNVTNGEPRELSALLGLMAQEFRIPLRTQPMPWKVVDLMARGLETAAQLNNGKEPPFTRYSAGMLAFSQTLDISAVRSALGYQPDVTISEGIRRHAEWWRGRPGSTSA
ncbi:MAG: NAD(P)-dependent oxidoreductase [Halothiobacillus sp.]|jgi:nucleoside-diphosphate-sugar epimerase|nr:NAD(P)-dependent oxidoreductase [Halothiobacillus sp.]